MRDYYFISRSWFRFLNLYEFRDCNLLPRVHFANHSILRSRLNGRQLRFKGGYIYWIGHLWKVNEKEVNEKEINKKEINETGILIFVFFNGIPP